MGAFMGRVELCRLSHGTPLQFSQQLTGGPRFTGTAVPRACSNERLDFPVAQLKIVFHLVGRHDADHGNTILFQDEILLAVMRPPRNLTQIDARFGDGKSMDGSH